MNRSLVLILAEEAARLIYLREMSTPWLRRNMVHSPPAAKPVLLGLFCQVAAATPSLDTQHPNNQCNDHQKPVCCNKL
ncbi:Uncharacterized protein HZ326_31305 [Fusarium oxysporum f. sp. albedinis]|nr:Uncharacterized protein HZ326_31305 [Fusarium oxysporum f. sp. albedinis]